MDDETVFGKELHKLSFGQAIEKELLTDYRVVIVGVTDPQVQELIDQRELVSVAGTIATDARTLAAHIGLAKATKDYDLKRTISFHGRIKTAQEFAQQHAAIVEWMPDDHKPLGTIWADTITGAMNSSDRRKLLNKLKADAPGQHALLSNARCLTEGIDVPSLDGVAFIDPRSSQVDIIQAVGRAIRKANNKALGTIVLPVLIPHDADADSALQNSEFKPIWAILNALRSHDDEFASELSQLRTEIGRSGTVGILPSKFRSS
jgi:predicted helicase